MPPSGPPEDAVTLAQEARQIFDSEVGEGTSAEQVATAAAQTFTKLSQHFSQRLGVTAVRALFDRSLMLTRPRFPWLVAAEAAPPSDAGWTRLRASLASQAPAVARDASLALLTTLLGLLGRLLGEALVLRLLYEVWPETSPNTPKETT
jgi:hypothetical protein